MIWKFAHAEKLTWREYDYWMTHTLPFGQINITLDIYKGIGYNKGTIRAHK